jgi:hypothetical protein
MKIRIASAVALSFAVAQLAALPANADSAAAEFRTAAPQTFSTDDLQLYGLAAADAERATTLQDQGYQVMVMTPEEAAQYTAGMTDSEWLLVGILAAAIVIAVAVA